MDDPQAFAALLKDWRRQEFLPFREGVEIAVLRAGAPGVALLRYAPGAGVPRHRHPALETILVLEGVQSDERGDYPAGSLILNPEGTEHSVWSETGCTVLIQWNLPVEFVT
jgi:anti-sigma factor ChrR (cupin superfamily)